MIRPDTSDYLQLFINDTPMFDVRAPVEFNKGAFPCAENLPLMNDEERHQVGIRYKEQGQEAAIALGHQLVNGHTKAERVAAWRAFASANPDGYLYCFRGGLRSRTSQAWLKEAGCDYPLVIGGYKAMRRFLINSLEEMTENLAFVVIGGRTGTGKTRVLIEQPGHVDMEAIAHHRGSSFGRTLTPQPSQIDFENRVTIAMLKARHQGHSTLVFEDESHLIGRCSIPLPLRDKLDQAPILLLETTFDERVQFILEDYVIDQRATYEKTFGTEQGFSKYRQQMLDSLHRIRRRLGGERYQQLNGIMETAIHHQYANNDLTGHRQWISILLREYYDPMYDYQLSKKAHRVILRGNRQAINEWMRAHSHQTKETATP